MNGRQRETELARDEVGRADQREQAESARDALAKKGFRGGFIL